MRIGLMYCLYIHTCPNGKVYIGITSQSINQRWKNQGQGYQKCRLFYRAIKKYGWDNIKHEILYTDLTLEEARNKERNLIEEYKSYDKAFGYNLSKSSLGADTMSKETKELLRKIKSEFRHSEKSIIKMSKPIMQFDLQGNFIKGWWGIKQAETELNIKGVLDCCKGKYQQAGGFMWKYASSSINKKISPYERKRTIIQYDQDYNYIKEWESSVKAGQALGITPRNIRSCCWGKRRIAGGFIWRFKTYNNSKIKNHQPKKIGTSVIQLDKSGNFIKKWSSMAEATRVLNIYRDGIGACCRGEQKTAGGFRWAYES